MYFRLSILVALIGTLTCCTGEPESIHGFPADRPADEIRIVLKSEPKHLNPLLDVQSLTRYVGEQIFQTLNFTDPTTYELRPALASVPTVEPLANGGMAYDYRVDSLARWPNGSRVTAADVIFSLKIILNPRVDARAFQSYYLMVSDVTITSADSLSFRVTTKRPYVLSAEALADLYVFPRYAYDPENLIGDVPLADLTDPERAERISEENPRMKQFAKDFNSPVGGYYSPENLVGSGPYVLESWESGRRIKLKLRDNYWAKDYREAYLRAVPEALTFDIISDNTTTANALRDQRVDVVIDVPIGQFLDLREEKYLQGLYDFLSKPSFKYFSILLNQDDPLLTDSLTRRALAHLVDVDLIIKSFLPGLAQRITGPVLPSKDYYNDSLPALDYNLDKARELLAAAGWEDSDGDGVLDKMVQGERKDFRFNLLTFTNPPGEDICLVIAENARQVGIDIEVLRQEPRALIERLNAGNFTASFYGQNYEPSPDDFSQAWASSSVPPSGTNRGNFRNNEADSLIRQIAATTDSAARAPLYHRFQEIVYENQPKLFLYSPSAALIVSKRLDYTLTSLAPNLRFNELTVRPTS